MLRINRSAERADAFHKFVKRNNLKTWSDFNDYPEEKNALRSELSQDQNNLDGYTEQSLYKAGNGEVNIEHFRCWAKFNWPKECYNYYNYVIANKIKNYGGDYKDNHIQKEDYDIIFNPIEEDMSSYVEYDLSTGEILPHEGLDVSIRQRVMKTIEVFNLCHDTLNASRKSSINEIVDISKSCKLLRYKQDGKLYIIGGILSPLFLLIFSRVARYTPSSSSKNRLK